ncbi:MAG TPA: hypothetical protein VMH22_10140 [bacterium]|nr:hypothetical protein [bacterium]
MTAPKKRAVRWKAKCNLRRVGEKLGDLREDLAVRQEATIPRVSAMETKVKAVLNACVVSTLRARRLCFTDSTTGPLDHSTPCCGHRLAF